MFLVAEGGGSRRMGRMSETVAAVIPPSQVEQLRQPNPAVHSDVAELVAAIEEGERREREAEEAFTRPLREGHMKGDPYDPKRQNWRCDGCNAALTPAAAFVVNGREGDFCQACARG